MWEQPAPEAVHDGARLFRGLKTSAAEATKPAKKRQSLFAKAKPEEKPVESTLQRIRAECVQWLGGLFGQTVGVPASKPEATEPVEVAANPAWEAPSTSQTTKRKASPEPEATPTKDDDDVDAIVPVAKHPKSQPGLQARKESAAASVPELSLIHI